ncbi:IclR family transcriptional regulator [Paenibacillus validus]|uniref:IclR family transcriptional regulator n=1 Tax=Paenibacillus validus TaxID=44253 RepID=UPI003D2B9662
MERALRILECFTMEKPDMFLGEIAEKSKLSKSTVHRLLATMILCGYVKQNEDNQKYSLSLKLFRLGSIVGGTMSLRSVALSFMKQLCGEISETVGLSIVDDDYRVCIEMVESAEVVRNFVKVGQRVPLYQGASSMVLLSFMPEPRKRRLIEQGEKDGQLLMTAPELMDRLEQIARLGYGTSVNDRIPGAFSVSAPVFDHSGHVVASLTAAGPVQRLTDNRLQFLIEKVTQSAHQISAAMGHSGVMMETTR